jgi:hypothetical protein
MKHRLFPALGLAALACVLVSAAAAAGGHHRQLFQFRGELLGAGSTAVQLQVEGGNHAALKALLGQSQNESFAVGSTTEFLVWQAGVPHVATPADLKAGDWVTVNVRAPRGSSLADLQGTPVATVSDRTAKPTPSQPLHLYVGTVAGAQAGGHIALHVTAGNRLGLRSLIGQPADQTFSYDENTIFLLWQHRVPTVIDASQLKAGDRITIRIRAPRNASLSAIEATAARHVGDHEPGNPLNQT